MSESEWKTKLAADMRKNGHYARRIEDQYGVGFPDMVTKLSGYAPSFIEVKMVRYNFYDPTPRQFIDLLSLNLPPLSYGIVLGIDERGGLMFHFSEPKKRVRLDDPETFHHPHFIQGLHSFLKAIRSKYD